MSEKKTISVDQSLFTGGSNKKSKKNKTQKSKKEKPIIPPNKLLKDKLLRHVKEHQNKTRKEKINMETSREMEDKNTNGEFEESMNYLMELNQRKKKEKRDKKLRKRTKKNRSPHVSLDNPSSVFSIDTSVAACVNSNEINKYSPPSFASAPPAQFASPPPAHVSNTYGFPSQPNITPPPDIPVSYVSPVSPINSGSMIVEKDQPNDHVNEEPFKKTDMERTNEVPLQINLDDFDKQANNSNSETGFPTPSMGTYELMNAPEPTWGCMKKGNKPTFKQWKNKTQKQPFNIDPHEEPINESNNNISIDQIGIAPPKEERLPNKYIEKKCKTTKTKFKLGKSAKNRKIGILIKNNKTRKTIQMEHTNLKRKSINEIKQELYKRNLLKIGSTAPNDVLRSMYEQSVLAGNIENNTSGILMHNFIEEENK